MRAIQKHLSESVRLQTTAFSSCFSWVRHNLIPACQYRVTATFGIAAIQVRILSEDFLDIAGVASTY